MRWFKALRVAGRVEAVPEGRRGFLLGLSAIAVFGVAMATSRPSLAERSEFAGNEAGGAQDGEALRLQTLLLAQNSRTWRKSDWDWQRPRDRRREREREREWREIARRCRQSRRFREENRGLCRRVTG